MTPFVLGISAAVAVVWAAHRSRRLQSRLDDLTPGRPLRDGAPRAVGALAIVDRIGGLVLQPLARLSWTHTAAVRRRCGLCALLFPVLVVWSPMLGYFAIPGVLCLTVAQHRSANRKRRQCVARDLPVVIDLLAIGVRSGLSLSQSFSFVRRDVGGPVGEVMGVGSRRLNQGHTFQDVLVWMTTQLGDEGRGFVSTLLAGERYGAPLNETLQRMAAESRLDQDRRADQAAKRLSVQLLFPLAGCLLPAFVLLTAAPLLAGSIGTLAFFN